MPCELQMPAFITENSSELVAQESLGNLNSSHTLRMPPIGCNKRVKDSVVDTYGCNLAGYQRAGYEVYILDPFESDPEVRQQSCSTYSP